MPIHKGYGIHERGSAECAERMNQAHTVGNTAFNHHPEGHSSRHATTSRMVNSLQMLGKRRLDDDDDDDRDDNDDGDDLNCNVFA